MVYVADTHSTLWFLTNDSKLGSGAREVFERAEKGETIIIIPTISLAEMLYVCEKKKVAVKFREILEKLKTSFNYMVFDLTLETVLKCADLQEITEMHDRIITATAKIVNASVITKDPNIKESGLVDVIW